MKRIYEAQDRWEDFPATVEEWTFCSIYSFFVVKMNRKLIMGEREYFVTSNERQNELCHSWWDFNLKSQNSSRSLNDMQIIHNLHIKEQDKN